MESRFTPRARKRWESFPRRIQIETLKYVYCKSCGKMTSMEGLSGKIRAGALVLNGTCRRCGHEVRKVIENN